MTSLRVAGLGADEEDAWDAFVAAHPEGRVYHTLAWRSVTAEGLGHTPRYLRAVNARGEIVGVLPLFEVATVLGRRIVSLPMRDRGGVLATSEEVTTRLVEAAIDLTRQRRARHLEIRSIEALPPTVSHSTGLTPRRHWVNSTIDLAPGKTDLWRAMPKTGVRQAVGRARKRGLSVDTDDSREAIVEFHRLFVRTRTAMGIPPYGLSFFVALHRHVLAPGAGHLFRVRKDGRTIGGVICLVSGDRLFAAYAAPQSEYRQDYPNELFFWHMIEWGCDRGLAVLDLGADSPQQEGLIRFKQKFRAAQHQTYNYFHRRNGREGSAVDSSAGSFSLARAVWSRFPLLVSRSLGAWVARQLD